jgi:hypothetical protein
MTFTLYDLRNVSERITEVTGYIDRQRARLDSVPTNSAEAISIGQILSAMERMLGAFQEHRNRIEVELKKAKGDP